MRSTIATVLAAILLLIGAPAAFAATPSNDTMANATTIAGLPFNVTPDLSGSTVEPGENVDCLFPSTKTVWYRYVVTQKQLLQVDVNSADPDAGVRIYYEYSGSAPALGNCVSLQYSGFQLMVQPVTTLWFQLSVNAGSDATLAVTSLPLLHVSATLDATATYNPKAGTVSIGGTIRGRRGDGGDVGGGINGTALLSLETGGPSPSRRGRPTRLRADQRRRASAPRCSEASPPVSPQPIGRPRQVASVRRISSIT